MKLAIQNNLDHNGVLYPKGSVVEVSDELGAQLVEDGIAVAFAEPKPKAAGKKADAAEPAEPTAPQEPVDPEQPSEEVVQEPKSPEEDTTPAPEAPVDPSSSVEEQQVPVQVKE